MLPTILSDSYKQSHYQMYPKELTKLYSNLTARKSRMPGVDKVIFFGLQYFVLEYLIRRFNEDFFSKPKVYVIMEHQRIVAPFSTGPIMKAQWETLHDLGYLPLQIKAIPEGTAVPIGVPMLTITNTHPDFAWLVNFIETILSTTLWQPITSATIALEYRKLTERFCKETGGDINFIDWQNHDFSMRGMSSLESAMLSGAGHLTVFKGSDTIPASLFLEKYYNATGLIAGSVSASEHSVMSCGGSDGEFETFARLIDIFPEGILSIVSDTWDLWKVCNEYLPKLKDKILSRNGKIVIRPDSGLPEDIICGYTETYSTPVELRKSRNIKGVIELLWDTFGGTINDAGYKVLDPHIGAIYGDGITLERAETILKRLKAKGFCSTNIVFGIGSFTYQHNTRDTFGMAVKATYCELEETFYASPESLEPGVRAVHKNIYKDPITDSGEKKSAKGLLLVEYDEQVPANLRLIQEVSWAQEEQSELKPVFENGVLLKQFTLEDVRGTIKNQSI